MKISQRKFYFKARGYFGNTCTDYQHVNILTRESQLHIMGKKSVKSYLHFSNVNSNTSSRSYTLQHTATHCNTLQHTATHRNKKRNVQNDLNIFQTSVQRPVAATYCNALLHIVAVAMHCNTLQRTETHATNCNTLLFPVANNCHTLQQNATHCNALQHTAVISITNTCIALRHTATHCNALQSTATHCKTLQHTAIYCNTLQSAL